MFKKRSISELDEGLTLGGPIRSTRQKTDFSLHATKSGPSTFELHVPQQSRETTLKILEHLERVEPFPKEKSLKAQPTIARAESSSPLNMNDDNAIAEAVSTLPFQISSQSSKLLASTFKSVSTSGFSGM